MKEYADVLAFLNLIQAPEDEVLSALLSAFGPPQPGALVGSWKKSAAFGHSAPSVSAFWTLFVDANFACSKCKSHLRLTIDHVDGNAKNHDTSNLQVLCFKCNRAKVGKTASAVRANVALYQAALALYKETGVVPKNKQIEDRAGIKASGGTYLLKFLRFMSARNSGSASSVANELDEAGDMLVDADPEDPPSGKLLE